MACCENCRNRNCCCNHRGYVIPARRHVGGFADIVEIETLPASLSGANCGGVTYTLDLSNTRIWITPFSSQQDINPHTNTFFYPSLDFPDCPSRVGGPDGSTSWTGQGVLGKQVTSRRYSILIPSASFNVGIAFDSFQIFRPVWTETNHAGVCSPAGFPTVYADSGTFTTDEPLTYITNNDLAEVRFFIYAQDDKGAYSFRTGKVLSYVVSLSYWPAITDVTLPFSLNSLTEVGQVRHHPYAWDALDNAFAIRLRFSVYNTTKTYPCS